MCVAAEEKSPRAHRGDGQEGAEAGTAATSPVTPEQAAVLKSQEQEQGGADEASQRPAASLQLLGPFLRQHLAGAREQHPFLRQSRAPRAGLRC